MLWYIISYQTSRY